MTAHALFILLLDVNAINQNLSKVEHFSAMNVVPNPVKKQIHATQVGNDRLTITNAKGYVLKK